MACQDEGAAWTHGAPDRHRAGARAQASPHRWQSPGGEHGRPSSPSSSPQRTNGRKQASTAAVERLIIREQAPSQWASRAAWWGGTGYPSSLEVAGRSIFLGTRAGAADSVLGFGRLGGEDSGSWGYYGTAWELLTTGAGQSLLPQSCRAGPGADMDRTLACLP